MEIAEVQKQTALLAQEITKLVQAFETLTGCTVHSIPVHAAGGTSPVKVQVKVQIPSAR